MIVSGSHRVMVSRGCLEAAPANSLRSGDTVFCRVPKNLDLLFKNSPGQHSQTCGAAKNLVAVPIMIHKLLLLVEKPWFYASSAAHAHVMDHGLRAAHASMSVPILTHGMTAAIYRRNNQCWNRQTRLLAICLQQKQGNRSIAMLT